MRTHHRVILLLALATGTMIYLWPNERHSSKPLDEAEPEMVCAICRMPLRHGGYGAMVRTYTGKVLWFDDLRCLTDYLKVSPQEGTTVFVEDHAEQHLLPLVRAHFVYGVQLSTPMTSHALAFGSLEVARRFALARQSTVVPFDELRELIYRTEPADQEEEEAPEDIALAVGEERTAIIP